MEIWFFYAGQALIFVIFAVSLNLLLGYAGQVSVAQAAFGAVGGYAVGYLTLTRGWNFVPAAGRRRPRRHRRPAGVAAGDEAVAGVPHPAHPGGVVGHPRHCSRRSPSSAAPTA